MASDKSLDSGSRKSSSAKLQRTTTVQKVVPLLPFHFTEFSRTTLGISVTILTFFTVMISLGMIASGLYMRFWLNEYTSLVESFNDNVVVYPLIALGVFTFFANGMGAFCSLQSISPIKRHTYKTPLLIYVYISIAVVLFNGIVITICFHAIEHLEDAFRGGFKQAMKEYNQNAVLRAELHDAQTTFECCGDRNYTDWFRVPWVTSEYSLNFHTNDTPLSAQGYYHDDVPFSCCNKFADRPCINMDIHTNKAHHNYDFMKDVNVYRRGCTDNIMDFFGDLILYNNFLYIFGLFGLQIIITLMVRYYQTCISDALNKDRPVGGSYGYFCLRTVDREVPIESNSYGSIPRVKKSQKEMIYESVDDFTADEFDDAADEPQMEQESLMGEEPLYENVQRMSSHTFQQPPPPPPLPPSF